MAQSSLDISGYGQSVYTSDDNFASVGTDILHDPGQMRILILVDTITGNGLITDCARTIGRIFKFVADNGGTIVRFSRIENFTQALEFSTTGDGTAGYTYPTGRHASYVYYLIQYK